MSAAQAISGALHSLLDGDAHHRTENAGGGLLKSIGHNHRDICVDRLRRLDSNNCLGRVAHRFEKDRVRASGEQRLDLHSKIYLAVDTFAPRTDAVPLAILDDLSDEMSRSLR